MFKTKLKQISEIINGSLEGDPDLEITAINDIKKAKKGELAFLLDKRYASFLESTNASCVVVPKNISKVKCAVIKCDNPQLAYIKAVAKLLPDHIPHAKGVHKNSTIAESAKIGKNVAVGAHAYIGDNAEIGDNTVIYPSAFIGAFSKIGSDCIFYPGVVIRENISIGNKVIIHPNSVIGSDGFGYDNSTGKHLKIPHIGTVQVEDEVEIGSCVTIDRAKFNKTRIGKGTKIDNLVQIAHNVDIGENCIIVAQCGISGSSTLGKNVILAGQVGLVDHVNVGDNVMVAAQSGVTKSVPANSIVFGSPAIPYMKKKKQIVLGRKLPEFYERLKNLEKKLEQKPKNKTSS